MSSILTTNISLIRFLIEDAQNYDYDANEHCSENYTYFNGDCFHDVKLDPKDWTHILDVVEMVLLEYEQK